MRSDNDSKFRKSLLEYSAIKAYAIANLLCYPRSHVRAR